MQVPNFEKKEEGKEKNILFAFRVNILLQLINMYIVLLT